MRALRVAGGRLAQNGAWLTPRRPAPGGGDIVGRMRWSATAGIAAAIALSAASSAAAVVGVWAIAPSQARPGDIIRARTDPHSDTNRWPVYVVPTGYICELRERPLAPCVRPSVGPPRGRPYTRIRRMRSDTRGDTRLSFRLPRVRPGRYRIVVYCEPCGQGPGGNLIASEKDLRVLGRLTP